MKCPSCQLESDASNFKLINQKDITTSINNQWEIISIFKKKSRLCPACKSNFSIGNPILYKKVKNASNPISLTVDIAKDAKKLIKRKKKYFSIADIQNILKIPIPIEAEKQMEIMVLCNLFKIVTYNNTAKVKIKKKYELKEEAEEIIYDVLGEILPDIAYFNKIENIDYLLNKLKNSYTKPQSIIIKKILNDQKNNKILYDETNNTKIIPSKYYTKYEIIITVLINLLDIIESEKILTTKEFMVNIGLQTKDLQKVKKNLIGILRNKLIYFNLLTSKNQIYLEPIPIPMEVSEEIAKLEILLRKKIIFSLKEYFGNYYDAFLNGIPNKISITNIGNFSKNRFEDNLRKQLKNNSKIDRTNKSKNMLTLYRNSGVCSLYLFEQFMQQLDFNHLITLIHYHWQTIFKPKFKTLGLNDVISDLRIIKDARNIDAHRKCKLVEIAQLIESMFKIKQKISFNKN